MPGEGVGAVLLKRLDRAMADGDQIYAVITATALNHGGRTNGYTVPNPRAQSDVIADALRRAGEDSADVSYIEAHGTGTALGDPIEVAGLAAALAGASAGSSDHHARRCALGSVKSNIGHLESAAGIAGLTKVLLQMRHGLLVPSLHADTLNPHLALEGTPFTVQRTLEPWPQPRRAGLSSFGAGGSNAHVLLESYAEAPASVVPGPYVVVLSCRSDARLRAAVEQLLGFIETETPSLADLAYTLQVGRERMERRAVFVASTHAELADELSGYLNGTLRPDDPRLPYLAKAWLAGEEVDWESLYGAAKPRRISLPGYPFAEERHWLRDASCPAAVHPLIDRLDAERSLAGQGTVFTKRLSRADAVVRDHEVRGVPVLPGAGYLEMALAAAALVRTDRRFSLEDIVWLQPLAVSGDVLDVQVLLAAKGDGLGYEVRSQHGLHGRGIVRDTTPQGRPERWSIDEIRRRCAVHIDGPALYACFAHGGLRYGPYLMGVRQLWGGTSEVLAEIALPQGHSQGGYTLHPCILDSAFQAIAGIGANVQHVSTSADTTAQHESSRFAPATTLSFAVDGADILAPTPERGYAYVRAAEHGRFHISVLNNAGETCVRLTNVSVRSMADALDNFFFTPVWRQLELPAPTRLQADRSIAVVAGPLSARIEQELAKIHSAPVAFVDGAEDLLRLSKSLPAHAKGIILVTVGAHAVFDRDTPEPDVAAAEAFAGVLAKEHPSLEVRTLDLTASGIEDETTWELAHRWLAAGGAADAAVRDGRLYSRWIETVRLPASAESPFRERGVYVIVGGAGGLGFEVSRHLARTRAARLTWIGRRQPDAVIDAKIREIESLGGRAIYMPADVADPAGLSIALDAAKAAFGAIHGVFHSAMDVRPMLIESMDADSLRAALHAKTIGSLVLADVLEDESLDFLIYFSSVQSIVRARGMAAYAAGCAFEDALAMRRSQSARYAVKTINWGYWGSVGPAAADEAAGAKRLAESLGFESIEPAEGMEALSRIVADRGRVRVICFKGDPALLGPAIPAEGVAHRHGSRALPFDRSTLMRLRDASAALQAYCRPLLLRMFQGMGVLRRPGEEYRLRPSARIAADRGGAGPSVPRRCSVFSPRPATSNNGRVASSRRRNGSTTPPQCRRRCSRPDIPMWRLMRSSLPRVSKPGRRCFVGRSRARMSCSRTAGRGSSNGSTPVMRASITSIARWRTSSTRSSPVPRRRFAFSRLAPAREGPLRASSRRWSRMPRESSTSTPTSRQGSSSTVSGCSGRRFRSSSSRGWTSSRIRACRASPVSSMS